MCASLDTMNTRLVSPLLVMNVASSARSVVNTDHRSLTMSPGPPPIHGAAGCTQQMTSPAVCAASSSSLNHCFCTGPSIDLAALSGSVSGDRSVRVSVTRNRTRP